MTNAQQPRERLEFIRRRGIQAIGAGISTRNWHTVEMAYSEARDMIDALLIDMKRIPAPPSADAAMVEEVIAEFNAIAGCDGIGSAIILARAAMARLRALDLASRQPAGVKK